MFKIILLRNHQFFSENEILKQILVKVFIYFFYYKKNLQGIVFFQSLLASDYMQNPLNLWRPQQSTARRPRKNPQAGFKTGDSLAFLSSQD